ncbi:MAG: ice-binding family protein [Bacteroidota bacterium]
MKVKLLTAFAAVILFLMPNVNYGQAPTLGTAANFVLFSTVGAVTNSGIPHLTHLTGNVGTNSGSSTGFGNVDGQMHDGDGASIAAASALLSLHAELAAMTPTAAHSTALGGGETLLAGIYNIPAATTINGVLTLNALGDPNALFVFKIGGALATGANTKVRLINGALACNVFWDVEGLVGLATGTSMKGTIVAHNFAINMSVADTLEGRALAINGAVNTNAVLAYMPLGCGSAMLTGPAAPALGAAGSFAVFSNIGAVTATPITYVTGDVGSNSTGTTGFVPGNVNGTIYTPPHAVTAAAASDLTIAYNYLNALSTDINLLDPANFGYDLVLTPHTYNLAGAPTMLTGAIYLNAQGNPNAVFVIKMSGALQTVAPIRINLINGAQAKNVYWKISGATYIASNSVFNGTIVGAGAIDFNTLDTLNGRALTISGAIAINGAFVTNNPAPCVASPITGTMELCQGGTTTLANVDTGGTWSSTNTTVATIGSTSGIVSGITAGTSIITFTSGLACQATDTVTVNPLPATIAGAGTVCAGATSTMTNTTIGGTWSSSNNTVATIGSLTGIANGIAAGTATISYILSTGCLSTKNLTVNPLPSAGTISGTAIVCPSGTTTLTSTASGGTWTSVNTTVATIGSASGILTGVALGTSTISYTVTNGCGTTAATVVATVSATTSAGTITGTATACPGGTTTLSSGVSGGTWTSVNTAVATIGSASGIVTGITSGTSTISYTVTNSCGTASATRVVTINAAPNAGTITGTATTCPGSTTTLSNAVSGGVWSSVNTSVATVGSASGIVTGVATGTSTISYTVTNGCGTAAATQVATVTTTPSAGTITGTATLCPGASTTLANAVSGGVWSSTNALVATVGSASGIVTGMAPGTSTISYTVTNSCGTAAATMVATVNIAPNAGTITGTASVCPGSTTTLSNAVSGGVWSSVNTSVATVGSASGIVTGVATGTSTISYTVTNSCGTAAATQVATVTTTPSAGTITGTATLCPGASTTLANAVSGGVWSSTNALVATVGSASGIVTGMAPGTATISYTVTNSCGTAAATIVATVNIAPNAGTITGTTSVCPGSTTTLSNTASGGVWSSVNTSVATIGSASGIVTGIAPGTSTISYTVTNSCGTVAATRTATVNTTPNAGTITGTATVCPGANTTLANTATGGVWSSVTMTTAIIGSADGIVTGITPGTTMISYTVSNVCGTVAATTIVTVNPSPDAGTITGPSTVCVGATTTLADGISGGIWSSSNSNATVNTAGAVTGVIAGNVTISYTAAGICGTAIATHAMTVNPLPNAGTITGTSGVCLGSTITLANAIAGGTWRSSNATAATVTGGAVTGLAVGTTVISYSVTNMCGTAVAMKTVTVNALPAVPVISIQSPSTVCVGTMYQNFGTATTLPAGSVYNWTAVNATVWAQGASRKNAIVNFTSAGAASVTLHTTITGTGCTSNSTVAITVGTSAAQTDVVSYFNNHFVCTPNNDNTYQWGYDDKTTLDSTILTGEINQDYVNASPDFGNKSYWVMTTNGGCSQKTYYRTVLAIQNTNSDAASVTVYPNPATTLVNVSVGAAAQGTIQIEVWNLAGQKIVSLMAVDNKAAIDITALPAGTYLVSCYNDGVRLSTTNFIKN